MCHPILGDTQQKLTVFIRKKKYPSGRIGVIVAEKQNGKMCELFTVGSYYSGESDAQLVLDTQEWISRDKGIRRLEKAYRTGALTKSSINNRGYNKFLTMHGDEKVEIDYDKLNDDSKWDGLKGYLTNTNVPTQQVYEAYHNLWNVEQAFRIAKSKIDIRPMFHFTRRRIEAHISICFVALKVYKELNRVLKTSGIELSVDKVLAMAQSITTIQIKLPKSNSVYTKTMLMKRHQKIARLFDENFWGTH